MTKGVGTKKSILETGLDLASRVGLASVTIGELAKAAAMSKSGLFAHFQSKEKLQVELLKYAGEIFLKNVVIPSLRTRAGEERVRTLVDHWIRYDLDLSGGCIFLSASSDFKDRPGKVRDYLLSQQEGWIACLRRVGRSAVEAGDFREDADCDQFAFEIYSLLLGIHLYRKLLDHPDTGKRRERALERLLSSYRRGTAETPPSKTPERIPSS